MTRRQVLRSGGGGLAALALGTAGLPAMAGPLRPWSLARLGPLQAPNELGFRLPQGFNVRVVAESGLYVASGDVPGRLDYRWHSFPDGGATFACDDGGWIYVSNSETASFLGAGTSALRFDASGAVVDAYRILGGTNGNCAGGPTPWNTWLSCEEIDFGRVFECDPHGIEPAQERPALGYFKHEAVAVDTLFGHLYLTEDEGDGRLYRYVPDGTDELGRLNLSAGRLQVAAVDAQGYVRWLDLPDANPGLRDTPTRQQLPESTAFRGGEGIWYSDGQVHFTTKGDNRVWRLDTNLNHLEVIYDAATAADPMLTGVDNLTLSSGGDILVAEDGGDMQIVVIDRWGHMAPLLQVVGQDGSEITGPAFSPDGHRLYFSSQRAAALRGGDKGLGVTYELTGPFARFLAPA
ncbi:DUF839 domain-containing protein [Mangrovimicrobium sediminis]|uniref:DUF839 domain-containing protein n=1 Tax=Mangrovimicrobium sediminis TaxID=2562682 RepID=A0A4Z0M8I6_9GAMM|nr:alkaline phosphatase PhoX [Haliea sp. SAOS-164]TGD75706.1 DUF839 domain-containing protein [Haliea sp. SAOS-164]